MPVALERKLKKEANEKGLSKKRKDAYVYGALRKTGWKPSREMNDTSKLIRLAEIDDKIDHLINFAYDDDEDKRSLLGTAAKTSGLVGAGVGGTLAHQAIRGSGGYAANWSGAKLGYKLAGTTGAGMPNTLGTKIGGAVGGAGQQIKYALSRLKTLLPGVKGLSSKDRAIEFAGSFASEKILEPWGPVPKTKIIQEQFPAGENPGMAPWAKNLSRESVLKLPFPQLMKYLNRPGILQQRWSGLSAKLDKIIEFAGGYINTPEGVKKERGAGAHFKRNAGTYIGGGLVFPVGAAPGWLIDRSRRKHNILEASTEKKVPDFLAKGRPLNINRRPDAKEMSSRLDELVEFKSKKWDEMKEKAKGKAEELKEKFSKKKGRKSHGGGT